jgi:hypothetical protein
VGNMAAGQTGSGEALHGFTDVKIDRRTALGNPFPMGEKSRGERVRTAVCDACDELMMDKTGQRAEDIGLRRGRQIDTIFTARIGAAERQEALSQLEDKLRRGESLRLLCHCHPKRCHGDGIARAPQQRVGGARGKQRHPT